MVGVVAQVDWSSVSVAAAFVLGSIVGTAATIVVMRTLMAYLRREMKD